MSFGLTRNIDRSSCGSWDSGSSTPWSNIMCYSPEAHDEAATLALRVQVPNYKVSTQSHNYDSEYGSPKYPIVRYFFALRVDE